MDEQVKEIVEWLKSTRRYLILHYMPADDISGDFGGIQYGDSFNTPDEVEKFNSYPKEVRVKAMKIFITDIINLAYEIK